MWKNDEIWYTDFEADQRDIARSQETINVERHKRISEANGELRNDDTGTKGGSEAVQPGLSQSSNPGGASNEEGTGTPGKTPKVAVKKKRLAVVPDTKADEDFKNAPSDLSDIVGQVAKANVVPEERLDSSNDLADICIGPV